LNDSFRLQVGGDLGCGHRLAEAVALHKVHAGGEQDVSTSSVVTFVPRLRPRLITACTIAAASAAFMENMKLRSILSLSNGRRFARATGRRIVHRVALLKS
jgi:hypothetical protein